MYELVRYSNQTPMLMHYGVKGMKWGIRRTPEQLGHKIQKMTKERDTLEKKTKTKVSTKTAKYESAAAKAAVKADKARYGFFKNEEKATKLDQKAKQYTYKATKLKEYAAKAEKRMYQLSKKIDIYQKTLDAIDAGTLKQGESFVENFFMQYVVDDKKR